MKEEEVVAEVDLSRGAAKARTVDIDAPEPEPTAFEGAKKRLLDLLKGKDRDFAAHKQEILARHERELEAFNEAKAAAIEKARLDLEHQHQPEPQPTSGSRARDPHGAEPVGAILGRMGLAGRAVS